MKILFLFALLLPSVFTGQTLNVQPGTVLLRLPHHIDPEKAIVEVKIVAKGGCLGVVQTRKGVYDYSLITASSCSTKELSDLKSVVLLVYIPGYRMVTAEFDAERLKAGVGFEPSLISLPTVRVNGRLVDSSRRPLPVEKLDVVYGLIEAMGYFGYPDGSFPSISIASTTTNADGEFHVELPALLEDPFFQRYSSSPSPGQFQLVSRDPAGLRDMTLKPDSIPLRANYGTLLVTKTEKGTISGRIGKVFLKENSLSEDLHASVRKGDTIISGIDLFAEGAAGGNYYANLKADGTFEVQLPAGKYDLVLRIGDRKVLVQTGITVEESKRREVQRP